MPRDTTSAFFPIIYIVGSNQTQNQLLALCLEKELTVECTCLDNRTVSDLIGAAPERVCVFLLDCCKRETAQLKEWLEPGGARTDNFHSALFNVDPNSGIEKLVHRLKIRGIFYQEDSRQVFLKGMQTILKGEMWLSRRILSDCVMTPGKEREADKEASVPLSKREKEILRLVALGFSNDEIAEKMNLSPHTVKTHIYHVYKKIGISNRLQATLWAAAYLC